MPSHFLPLCILLSYKVSWTFVRKQALNYKKMSIRVSILETKEGKNKNTFLKIKPIFCNTKKKKAAVNQLVILFNFIVPLVHF